MKDYEMKDAGHSKDSNLAITREGFPALSDFLRGYLNQDVVVEYGSVENAVRSFLKDASPSDIDQLCKEWKRFRDLTRGESLSTINGLLSRKLGSGWLASSSEELGKISEILESRGRAK